MNYSRTIIFIILAIMDLALAGPFVRRAVNQTAVDQAKLDDVVAVLNVISNNGKWVVGNQAASVSTNLLDCSGNTIPDSSVSTGDDFVAIHYNPTVNATNSCVFYDSSAFNYDNVVNQAVQTPVTRDALLADTSKTVVCTDVDECQLPVCYDLTGTQFTFARFLTNEELVSNANSADDSAQYTTSSDLADLYNSGEPLPSGIDDYVQVPAYIQNGTSVYEIVIFNSTDNYYIGTSQEFTFSVPYDIGTSFYNFTVELWSTIGTISGSISFKVQDVASNITNVDALNNTQLSWTVNVTTSALNVSNATDTNATQVNYYLAVFGHRSFSGPNALSKLPWDPVYYGLFENVYTA